MKEPVNDSVILHDTFSDRWLEFRSPRRIFQTRNIPDVLPLLKEISELTEKSRLYAAGFISYDASPAFDESLVTCRKEDFPLLWFGIYEKPVAVELPPSPGEVPDEMTPWTAGITEEEYLKGVAQVQDEIRKGNTYQVNYTYRLASKLKGSPWDFFLQIREAQNARYGAYIQTDSWSVCSASPELFFTLQGEKILSKPMKGTIHRAPDYREDLKQAAWLKQSEKNRAENLMIVDMIRNDLGRIALTGSVKVPKLFTLEKYPTLWQMTSLVEAETASAVPDIFKALFPCASITGAPKCRTMEIIRDLESDPRGLYTGTIGYLAPGRQAQFNVAIRTAVFQNSSGLAEYGTGGGITWDSVPREEYGETITKARVLTLKQPDFSLLETLLWEPEKGYFLLNRHLDRLTESAAYFDYPCNRQDILTILARQEEHFPLEARRVRLLLTKQGDMSCEDYPYTAAEKWKIKLSGEPVCSTDPFLYHKTTNRSVYNYHKSLLPHADDVILWNEKGEITESCIGNLVIVLEGEPCTPPVSSGLLAGTYRNELLCRGAIKERIIYKDDLEKADEIYLINSLRKKQPVVFL